MQKRNILSYMVSLGLLSLTLVSVLILSTAKVFAEQTAVDNVTVTVPEACTITTPSGSGQVYNVEMTNGQYKNNIGKTRLSVFCNNNESFAIYAVGYSGDTFGNTEMITSTTGATNIATGTATGSNSSDPSNWAMKLEAVTGTGGSYTPTIVSPFNNFAAVPSSYNKVAEVTSTITGNTAEAAVDASYAVYISLGQAAGSYTGKVRYTVVHPSSAVPNQPYDTEAGKIGYYPNANGEAADTMGDQTTTGYTSTINDFTTPLTPNSEATLWASNFKRDGYGFVGWSDKYDWVVNNQDENGNGTGPNAGYHIYGPNQTITTPSDLATKGLSLYAVWVKSQGNLQSWQGCNMLEVGDVTALTDQRDGNTYAIAKLRDNATDATIGKCWMVENLRLDNTNSDNATGALAQGYGTSTTYGNFSGLANPETTNLTNSTTANSLYYSGAQSGTATINIGTSSYPAYRMPRFNNNNTNSSTTSGNPNTTVNTMTNADQNVYSYGNYYTWHAAIADLTYNGTNNQSTTTTSLCPKGWKLPVGGNSRNATNSDFWNLIVGGLNNGTLPNNYTNGIYPYYTNNNNTEGTDASNKLRTYPNNILYSGDYYGISALNRGSYGFYWSSTAYEDHNSYILSLGSATAYPGTNRGNHKPSGLSIRCLAQ